MFKHAKLSKPVKPENDHEALPHDIAALNKTIVNTIREIHDPEIPVNIYDLGLICRIIIDDQFQVKVDMTLTAAACPVAGTLPGQVEDAIRSVSGVTRAEVKLVWDPPWTQECMTDEARLELGLL